MKVFNQLIKNHKIKLFGFFCLVVAIIIGLSVKYTLKKNQNVKPITGTSKDNVPPITNNDSTDSTNSTDSSSTDSSSIDSSNNPSYEPTIASTSLPTSLPTQSSTGLDLYAPTNSSTTIPVVNDNTTYYPISTPVPMRVPMCTPILNGEIGDCCEYNETCNTRVCGNTQQTIGTLYQNTCLPKGLPKGSVCYKDQSCQNYSCQYSWFSKRYECR